MLIVVVDSRQDSLLGNVAMMFMIKLWKQERPLVRAW